MIRFFKVADFVFSIKLEHDCDLGLLLSSFSAFGCDDVNDDERLFDFMEEELPLERPDAVLLEEDRNDMGHTMLYRIGTGYRVELRYGGVPHVIETGRDFRRVSAKLRWEDAYVSTALSSMLRIVFAQAILKHSAVSVHASAVVSGENAYLFMGRSGTGKSTHSRLWMKHLDGTWLLNDDNPIVRVMDGKVVAYGSPWSGKTPCYRNFSFPVAAMVRLVQAPYNRFDRKCDIEAFSMLLPGCSAVRHDGSLYGALCDTLVEIIDAVSVGVMECRPDEDAVRTCRSGLGLENK